MPPWLTDVARVAMRNVSKRFGPQVALDGLDLRDGRGGIHTLVGQKASGKSTLMKILAGYHQPTAA
jgi:ABC-type sugar transport system ATPase subunit